MESGDFIVAGLWFAGYFPRFAIIYTDDKGVVKTIGVSDPDMRGEGLHKLYMEEVDVIR